MDLDSSKISDTVTKKGDTTGKKGGGVLRVIKRTKGTGAETKDISDPEEIGTSSEAELDLEVFNQADENSAGDESSSTGDEQELQLQSEPASESGKKVSSVCRPSKRTMETALSEESKPSLPVVLVQHHLLTKASYLPRKPQA